MWCLLSVIILGMSAFLMMKWWTYAFEPVQFSEMDIGGQISVLSIFSMKNNLF